MKRMFAVIGLGICLGLMGTTGAAAKLPIEVTAPYKDYRTALEAGNSDRAASKAYQAWQNAEDMLGDSKFTGDLASNLADMAPRLINGERGYKKVKLAYERSIDLARFYDVTPDEIEVQRRIDYLGWANAGGLKTHLSQSYGWKTLEAKLEEFDLQNTTYEADLFSLDAQVAVKRNQWARAEERAKKAIHAYQTVPDDLPSYFRYVVPSYLAQAHSGQGEDIEAALVYQDLIDRLESQAGHRNPLSAEVYGKWLKLRDDVLEIEGDDPRLDLIRNYVVPTNRGNELQPLLRPIPKTPDVFRRGSHSGWVQVGFDLDVDGRPINARVLDSTTKKLHKSALKSLEGWRYTPNMDAGRRADLKVVLTYNLMGPAGIRKSFPRPEPE